MGAARHKQQGVVLERTLGMEADSACRIVKVVERGLVELVVVLLLDIGAVLFQIGVIELTVSSSW